jgi:hypothetical protein
VIENQNSLMLQKKYTVADMITGYGVAKQFVIMLFMAVM